MPRDHHPPGVEPPGEPLDPGSPVLRPTPAGLVLSRASWELLDEVTGLDRACELDRTGLATTRPEDVRVRWLEADGFDDTLVVRDEAGTMVAYEEFVADVDPATGEVDLFVDGRVHPDHTRRGIASFLLDRAEDRAQREALRHGLPRVLLRTTVVDLDAPARRFFLDRGFVPVRHFLKMDLDLTEPPPLARWPDGVTVRRVTPDDDRLAWQVWEAAFADHPTHLPTTFEDWRWERTERDPSFDRRLWWLVVASGRPVALCLCDPGTPAAPATGRVRDLGVVPDWRRRGLAMALLRLAFSQFRARGLTGAALDVDDVTLDGAVALYQAAGMRIARRTDVLEKVVEVPPA